MNVECERGDPNSDMHNKVIDFVGTPVRNPSYWQNCDRI